ncbi:MAG TPA: hypothetical protein VFA28_21190 [Bryobacteraceae bacterium]|nr:hypothetical protein [Bryobacteraceae bacterium]
MDELQKLFCAYREAIPDPEPSADFTPGVWRGIDARRSSARLFRRFAQVFVAFAAVLTVLMGVVVLPYLQRAPVYRATYIDVLAEEHASEETAALADGIQQPDFANEAVTQ